MLFLRALVTMTLVVQLAAWRAATLDAAEPAPAVPANASPARIILLRGPTSGTAKFHIHDDADPAVAQQHSLTDGRLYLFQNVDILKISFGKPVREQQLEPGMIYEFCWVERQNYRQLQLQSRPFQPTSKANEALARNAELQKTIDGLKSTVDELNGKLADQVRLTDEAHAEIERVQAMTSRVQLVATDAKPMAMEPVQLGPLTLTDRHARVEISVSAPEGWQSDGALSISAETDRPFVKLHTDPAEGAFDAAGKLRITLQLDNVPSSAPLSGKLLLRRLQGGAQSIVVPYEIRFQPIANRTQSEPSLLRILSWPAGARVFLTPLSLDAASARSEIGTTPIDVAVPAGNYRIELLPSEAHRGRWIGPAGVAEPLNDSELFMTTVSTSDADSTMVRAVCLPTSPDTAANWEFVTKDAPALFAVPNPDAFNVYISRVAAQAGGRSPSKAEVVQLRNVIAKTGFLRLPISPELLLDVDATDPQKILSSRVRRVSAAVSEMPAFTEKPQ